MGIAIFDLDHTLIDGDSDYLWGLYLVEQGIVDRTTYEARNAEFYEDYKHGRLDIHAFLRFALKPLSEHKVETLKAWREGFLDQKIRPILLPKAKALIEDHRDRGHTVIVITATNRFVTEPIAALYDVKHLIATEPEMVAGCYTGQVVGIPCFAEGKVTRLENWLDDHDQTTKDCWFYSDSHNDLALLEHVDHPVAVDPDPILSRHALKNNWSIISLR